jgi:hypothetical protein
MAETRETETFALGLIVAAILYLLLRREFGKGGQGGARANLGAGTSTGAGASGGGCGCSGTSSVPTSANSNTPTPIGVILGSGSPITEYASNGGYSSESAS